MTAQAIKNARTHRAAAVRAVRAEARVALSGTPVENHLGELWSMFYNLSPGLLGSLERFRERFQAPIERDQDQERRAALARRIRPFVLRRTKTQVAPELPPRTEVVLTVELSRLGRENCEAARKEALAAMLSSDGADPRDRFHVLAAINRLRRMACHPRLDDPSSLGTRRPKIRPPTAPTASARQSL